MEGNVVAEVVIDTTSSAPDADVALCQATVPTAIDGVEPQAFKPSERCTTRSACREHAVCLHSC